MERAGDRFLESKKRSSMDSMPRFIGYRARRESSASGTLCSLLISLYPSHNFFIMDFDYFLYFKNISNSYMIKIYKTYDQLFAFLS